MPYQRCRRSSSPDRQRRWNRRSCQSDPQFRMWPLWGVCGRNGIAWKSAAAITFTCSVVAHVQSHRSSRANADKREVVMKSSLLSALVISAVVWPAAAYSQTGAAAMGMAIKTDDIKWEPLEGGFEISILY